MIPERIYIAGPYQPKDCTLHNAARIAQHNTDKAIEAGNHIIARGHFVFIPHLSHYVHIHHSSLKDMGEWWYEEDNTFLDYWATAFYYLAPSYGADEELKRAKALNLIIYTDLWQIPNLTEAT